jgi:hypothetical protein
VRGDSGSWVFKGEDVHGVVIAGSVEASGEHYAYAISITDVCRNISIGMGNASVHFPTTIENAITAHQVAHQGRDTAELATLYIKQLVHEVAQNGNDPMEPRLSNDASTSCSSLNALLTLARVCPLIKPPFDISGRRLPRTQYFTLLLTSILSSVLVNSATRFLREILQYDEIRNIAGLVAILFSVDPDLDAFDVRKLIQRTMAELGIYPQPSTDKLVPLMRQLGLRYPYLRDPIVSKTPFSSAKAGGAYHVDLFAAAPKLLARLFYAVSVRKFFVYCGPWAQWLHQLSKIVNLRVIMIDADFDRSSLKELWVSQVPALVIPESQLDYYSTNVRARFSTYGDVVEHLELRDLLWRLANR